ncbi:MAG: sulfite exporter TauE/SafE family protein [Candidatus Zixiibacteriota bacterium]
MSSEINILIVTAISIGSIHTLIGPDHYLPFIMMSKARGWSISKTIWITLACGIGHVFSSVILGLLGIGLGLAVGKLEAIEAVRGALAAWALITFGSVYAAWGIRRTLRDSPHTHTHSFGKMSGITHMHAHDASEPHEHPKGQKANITPWVLFTVFVLGPCEPLIPILMYPASQHDTAGVLAVTTVFGLTTILTMVLIVFVSSYGFKLLPMGKLDRFSHAIAGSTIALSGIAIKALGI